VKKFNNLNDFLNTEKIYHQKLASHIEKWQGETVNYIHSSGKDYVYKDEPRIHNLFAVTNKYVYLFQIYNDPRVTNNYKAFYDNIFDYTDFLSKEFYGYFNSQFAHSLNNKENFDFQISQEIFRKRGGWKKLSKEWREEKLFQKNNPDKLLEYTLCHCEYMKIPLTSVQFFYSSNEEPYLIEKPNTYVNWGYCMKITAFESKFPQQFPFSCNNPKNIKDYDIVDINPYSMLFGKEVPELKKQFEFLDSLIEPPF